MTKRKTVEELKAENRVLRQHGIGGQITKVLLALIQYGAYVAIVFMVYLSVDSLSGKTTRADINVQAAGSMNVGSDENGPVTGELPAFYTLPLILLILFGVGGIAYGNRQRKLRGSTMERLQRRIQELELIIDRRRTSSKLTPQGDTNPEDL